LLHVENSLKGAPAVDIADVGPTKYSTGGSLKRALDVLVALTGLAVLWPLMLFVIIAIRITDPGPAIFGHERIGYNGRRFKCLKFRSMVVNADGALRDLLERDPRAADEWAQSQKLKNDPRVTRLGKVLRETSYDERVSLDVDYVKNWSILRDINIIAKTAVVVFARKGSY
jgi:lipopolysaccharide/colanic/teichoic acid biosynthesis glycosyltransferase